METQTQPIMPTSFTQKTLKETDIDTLFKQNIYGALQDAMSIKTDDMDVEDFKNLVVFILNAKCNLI